VTKNLVFIDSLVTNYKIIAAGLSGEYEYVILDAEKDGVLQMQAAISGYSNLDSIQVISHGSVGALYLGSVVLNQDNLSSYHSELSAIGASLTAAGDILLYGCNVALGDAGGEFVNSLGNITGTDIAASSDLTGGIGNFILEENFGIIDSNVLTFESKSALILSQPVSELALERADGNSFCGVAASSGDNNDYMLTWAHFDWTNGWEIKGQVFNSSGASTSPILNISGDNVANDKWPCVDKLSNGNWVVVWAQTVNDWSTADWNPPATYNIKYEIYNSSGSLVSGERIANDSANQFSTPGPTKDGAEIAALSDGGFVIAWDGSNGVCSQKFDSSGTKSGGVNAIGSGSNVSITSTTDGGYVVVWHGSGVEYQKFDSNNSPVGGVKQISSVSPADGSQPEVSALSGGGFVIAWSGEGANVNEDIFHERFNASGDPIEVKQLTNTTIGGYGEVYNNGCQTVSDITSLDDGGFVVVWSSLLGGGEWDIYTQRYDSLGDKYGGETKINLVSQPATGTNLLGPPAIEALSDGGYLVTWTSSDHNGASVMAQRYDSAGNPVYTTANSLVNKSVSGNSGDDWLVGGSGSDTLDGGAGWDTMIGGAGNDIYFVDDLSDCIYEANDIDRLVDAGGVDLVNSSSVTYTLGAFIENGRILSSGGANIYGNALNNILYAGGGDNVLDGIGGVDTASYQYATGGVAVSIATTLVQNTGGSGLDKLRNIDNLAGSNYADRLMGDANVNIINGLAGADSMIGGDGSDTYYVDNVGDVVTETNVAASMGGADLVNSYLSAYTLTANVEKGRILSISSANIFGNTLNNVLYAGSGVNVIDGSSGTDTISFQYASTSGAAGITLSLATVDGLGYSTASGISGADKVIRIENITGTNYADKLTGNAGANVLIGLGSNDTMVGGAGNDIYSINTISDVVTELSGQGTDRIQSAITYSLADTDGTVGSNGGNVEDLQLTGTGNINGTGNGLNNVLFSNAGNNVMDGVTGLDTASYQYAGAGVIVTLASSAQQNTVGAGLDTLNNIDNLTGSNYVDTLTGNGAENVLNGLVGADLMAGGDGSDTFYVDNAGDVVTETNATLSTGGSDLVNSYLTTYTLGTNVENGRVLNTGAANITGNTLANVLFAGSGNNVLDGLGGVDTASYQYASAGVTVSLSLVGAQTTVGSGSDTLNAIENITGSNYVDTLTGGTGANTITGLAGKDIMTGNGGADTFKFNAITDSATDANRDVILDFGADDVINLVSIDANTGLAGDQAFSAIKTGTFSSATSFTSADVGKLFFDTTSKILYGNTDTDAAAEFSIQLTLTGISTVSTADFAL